MSECFLSKMRHSVTDTFLLHFSEFLFWREEGQERGGSLMFSRLPVLEGFSFLSYIKNKFFINAKEATPDGFTSALAL